MKTNLLKSIFISLLLLVGATNAWAYVTYYLKSDNTTWNTSTNDWGFTHNTTTTTYMANGSNFKLWRTDWGNDGWFGVDNGKLKPGDGGLQFLQYKGNVQYNGPSGMVCFHMDQGGSNSDSKPWVWITRPTFYLKHNWSGGSWTWKALTDNEDGTYQLTDYYGGTILNYGDNNDNNSNGWASVTATNTGTLSTGNKCLFTFNSADKTINITRLYTIKYDGNGSTTGVPSDHDKKHGTNTTLSSSTPTRTGYTFAGWNTKADGSGTDYAKGATYSANADVTLYAKWTANVTTHTVTFGVHSSGHGTLAAKAGNTSINSGAKVNQGSSITFTANPSTGYEVAGWYSNSGCTSAIAGASTSTTYTINSLAAAATVYVKFQGKKYIVTLSNQGATTAGTASVQATYGSAMPSATMPTKTGYTFGGYYISNNGGGTQYYTANGASARIWNIAENTTLYAKWTANQYTITYKDQNNANFSGSHASEYPTKHTYGTATTLKTATKTGYTFDGWHTDAACTKKVTSLGERSGL